MKRPLVVFTAVFACSIAIQLQWNLLYVLRHRYFLVSSLLIFLTVISYLFLKTRLVCVAVAGILCGLWFAQAYTTQIVMPIRALDGKTVQFSGIVQQYAEIYEENQRISIKIPAQELGIENVHPKVKMLLYVPLTEQVLQPGDRITVTANTYVPSMTDGFDKLQYYSGNGVFLLGKYAAEKETPDIPISFQVDTNAERGIWCLPLQISHHLKQQIKNHFSKREAGFINAIVFGDKQDLQSKDKRNLQKAGLAHATAVSGMHVGFLVSFVLLLFGKKYGSILSVAAILLFIPMAGATPSVMRAGIMYLFSAIAFCINQEYNGLNTLAVALLFLLCGNPYAIFSISLQLSFCASLGLILCGTKLQNRLFRLFARCPKAFHKIIRFLIGSLSASCCALFFTMPIMLLTFGYVSILAPISNLLVICMIGVLFIAAFLYSLFSSIPVFGMLCGKAVHWLSAAVLHISAAIAKFPYGMIYRENPYGIGAILVVYVCVICLFVFRKYKKQNIIIPAMILCFSFTILGINEQKQITQIHIIPCGTGQAIFIASPQETTLIDCSASAYRNGASLVEDTMFWYGYDAIDALILTSLDKTHARNVPELLTMVPVRKIIVPKENRESELQTAIWDIADKQQIPIVAWQETEETPYGIFSLIGEIQRKLIVRIAIGKEDLLILHSITQKMLQEYLQQYTLHAKTLVLSEQNVEDADLFFNAVQKINPSDIILESGFGTQNRIFQYKVRNTYIDGQVKIRAKAGEVTA